MEIDQNKARILGLSSSEIVVLSVLSDGSFTILNLSKTAGVPRTSLYYILKKLSERGFVKRRKLNKKIYWENTTQVESELSTHKTPDSIKLSPTPQTSLEIIFGDDVVRALEDMVVSLPKNSRIYGIQPETSLLSAVTNGNVRKINILNDLIKKKGIIMEGVLHEKALNTMSAKIVRETTQEILKSLSGRSADTVKLPEKYMDTVNAEVYLYTSTVIFMNWNEQFAIVIKNKNVFQLVLEMFRSTKYMLEKYDQNEKIAKMLVELEKNNSR